MGLERLIGNMFGNVFLSTRRRRMPRSKVAFESIESLETRLVLYAATGNAWPTSQLVTISFEPDGTNLGGVTSDLFDSFNGASNLAGRWQTEIIRAAQTWSQVTDINFVVVTDNGAASGSGKNQQGDPGFGDIRIGGFDFNNTSLARAYMPPGANNFSVAGDIVFNTGIAYGVGTGYDLYTVALHELGHALGLDHTSASSSAAMWSSYNGIKTKLSADDIAGIRSIYSGNDGRSVDEYDLKSGNNTFGTASDVTSELAKASASAVVTNLDITTNTDVDYYKFTAPKWTDDQVVIGMQATGLSLLSPKLTVYAADQKTVIGTATATSQYGGTVSVTVTGVDVGEVFYIKAEGATGSAFGVGNYALTLDLGAKKAPVADSIKTTKANGKTPTSKGGVAEGGGEFDTILAPVPVIQTISPDTGTSSTDRTTNSRQIVLQGVAPALSTVEIFQDGVSIGKFLNLLSAWSFSVPGDLADGDYTFTALGANILGQITGVSDAVTITVDTQAPSAPTLNPITGALAPNGTLISQPSNFSGTTDPSSLITIFDNGSVLATTTADGYGNWSYDLEKNLSDGTHRFSVTATDLAGNRGAASGEQVVSIDMSIADPRVTGISSDTGISGQDNLTQSRNLTIQGVAEAFSVVTVFQDGSSIGTTVAASNGTWSFDYSAETLNDGTYSFTARAVDAAGNVSNLSGALLVTVDGTISDPSVSFVTKTTTLLLLSNLTVNGVAEANSTVQVYLNGNFLTTTTADSQGSWSYQYSPLLLPNGVYRFSVSSADAAGNQSALSEGFNLVLGSSAPPISNLSVSSASSNTSAGLQVASPTPTIAGTATKGTTVSIFDGGKLLGTVVVPATGKWTFITPSLTKGRHTLVAVATNAAGSGLPSTGLTIIV